MPTYVYGCPACNIEYEQEHGMLVNPVVRCPSCKAGMERVPQASSVHFKGGFAWDSENNGKGKWISGLGKASDPKAYCHSLSEAEEKAKKRGLSYEKG